MVHSLQENLDSRWLVLCPCHVQLTSLEGRTPLRKSEPQVFLHFFSNGNPMKRLLLSAAMVSIDTPTSSLNFDEISGYSSAELQSKVSFTDERYLIGQALKGWGFQKHFLHEHINFETWSTGLSSSVMYKLEQLHSAHAETATPWCVCMPTLPTCRWVDVSTTIHIHRRTWIKKNIACSRSSEERKV